MRRIVGAIISLALLFVLVPASNANASTWKVRTVYVENHAPGWPVRSVSERMDNGLTINLVVVKKCPRNRMCIRVYGVRNLPGRVVGNAATWYVNDTTVGAKIKLENKWRRNATWKQKKSLVCHEMGHALGLPHSRNPRSCMYPIAERYRSDKPSAGDRRKLKRWY